MGLFTTVTEDLRLVALNDCNMAAQTGSTYISGTTIHSVKIPTANLWFSTMKSSLKVLPNDETTSKIQTFIKFQFTYNNFICNIKPSNSIYHSFHRFPSMVPKNSTDNVVPTCIQLIHLLTLQSKR